ncbi:adenylate/guanylate cyclase domain-containing protein [Pseudaminobacter sp. 19-2017]|uniref:Adenylate/guanylate cyclase domain-containing protein n=1 Tax=Pseudaminobacter soli (ex Zhang et al. 2022) TaxID=2831468 RepID=A0A942E2T5_9HYPH|nr:adenylate/guanylate cyclase domain-containing protein [Pseudaminobacter soli]MBS3650108.1 adenylate/guanylate cyclase domain-containing protein [Pseudaminobacter soli]
MATGTSTEVSTILMDRVADWLTQSSLAGDDLETIIRGFCERVAAAGLPLARVHLTFSMLHPLYDALGFTWERGSGMRVEGFRNKPGERSERFLRSPYYHLLANKLDHLRRRIDPNSPSEFPIFDELKKLEITDYIAFKHYFGAGKEQGMMGSWSTDSPTGFSEAVIAALLRIQNNLAVAAKMAVLHRLADNMLTTYLGPDAGKRVLNGNIRRGQGDTIRAALVMADMRGSTMLAEQEGREAYIESLNQFFDAIAAPFNRSGGQILSFLGDGFLAVYPCDRHHEPSEIACRTALAATAKATARMQVLNERRRLQGRAELGYGIGLHVGNVMFGNVGLNDRLTFSAFGSSVNQVQRLQALTKKYPQSVIASEEFANYCGGSWITLGREKLQGVKEKLTIQHPDIADFSELDDDGSIEISYDGVSDAEQLMLLLRDTAAGQPGSGNGKAIQ